MAIDVTNIQTYEVQSVNTFNQLRTLLNKSIKHITSIKNIDVNMIESWKEAWISFASDNTVKGGILGNARSKFILNKKLTSYNIDNEIQKFVDDISKTYSDLYKKVEKKLDDEVKNAEKFLKTRLEQIDAINKKINDTNNKISNEEKKKLEEYVKLKINESKELENKLKEVKSDKTPTSLKTAYSFDVSQLMGKFRAEDETLEKESGVKSYVPTSESEMKRMVEKFLSDQRKANTNLSMKQIIQKSGGFGAKASEELGRQLGTKLKKFVSRKIFGGLSDEHNAFISSKVQQFENKLNEDFPVEDRSADQEKEIENSIQNYEKDLRTKISSASKKGTIGGKELTSISEFPDVNTPVEDFIKTKDGITPFRKDDLMVGGTDIFGEKGESGFVPRKEGDVASDAFYKREVEQRNALNDIRDTMKDFLNYNKESDEDESFKRKGGLPVVSGGESKGITDILKGDEEEGGGGGMLSSFLGGSLGATVGTTLLKWLGGAGLTMLGGVIVNALGVGVVATALYGLYKGFIGVTDANKKETESALLYQQAINKEYGSEFAKSMENIGVPTTGSTAKDLLGYWDETVRDYMKPDVFFGKDAKVGEDYKPIRSKAEAMDYVEEQAKLKLLGQPYDNSDKYANAIEILSKTPQFKEKFNRELGNNANNQPFKIINPDGSDLTRADDFIVNKDGITKYNKDDLLIGGTNLFGDKKTKTTDNFKNSMKEAWSELIKGGGELFNPVEAKKETLAMYERITSLIQKTITDRKRDETRNDMQLINTNIFGGDSGSGKPSEIFVPVELDFVRY